MNFQHFVLRVRATNYFIAVFALFACTAQAQNRDPLATEIITEDLDRFWIALEKAGPEVNPKALEDYYLKPGSKGVTGFMRGRIESPKNLSAVIRSHTKYYHSIRPSLDSIAGMKDEIRQSLVKLKAYYPDAIFPPVYFVVGALNSGGTSSREGLIIGGEMYGATASTPLDEMNTWLRTVLKPASAVPHIAAHELIHFQQNYDGGTLLAACIKEGSADFLAELISGKHINGYVHEYADPREKELWLEFKDKMNGKNFSGWLYSGSKDRPHDLGYWMGYKITKAYFDKATDKNAAVKEILNIKDFNLFLEQSGYATKFE
jgi:hypothetical protein